MCHCYVRWVSSTSIMKIPMRTLLPFLYMNNAIKSTLKVQHRLNTENESRQSRIFPRNKAESPYLTTFWSFPSCDVTLSFPLMMVGMVWWPLLMVCQWVTTKPLALMVLNFKLRHYATLSTKPIGSMGLDDLPTWKVKNGHMNNGKRLGKSSSPMDPMGNHYTIWWFESTAAIPVLPLMSAALSTYASRSGARLRHRFRRLEVILSRPADLGSGT